MNLGEMIFGLNTEFAYAYYYLGEYEKSYDYLTIVKNSGRDDLTLKLMFANTLSKMRKYEEALEYYLELLKNDKYKNDTTLNCQIGWNYGELEKPKEALKYLFKAEELGKMIE